MASVPTGTPRGIWTIERSESTPLSVLLSTGTPSTGRIEIAASMPGKCAAPPAPAMISSSPRPSASRPYWKSRSGVRWAETTFVSTGMPSSRKTSAACRIVSQSDLLPMTTPTRGVRGISADLTMSPSPWLAAGTQTGRIASPIRITPPSRTWARNPPRWIRASLTPRRVNDSRCEHGSHSLMPWSSDLADPELLADQVIERDAPRDDVAPGLDGAELDPVISAHGLDGLGLDQRDLAVGAVLAVGHPFAAELPIPFQSMTGHRDHLVDRVQRLFRRRADEQGHDRRAR